MVLTRAAGTPLPVLIQRYHTQGQPFPPPLALTILRQLLHVLAVAHRSGIVYNDVKAEHLFWTEDIGQLHLIDWGNAQFVGESSQAAPTADVYQCGELLYELIAGDKYVRPTQTGWAGLGQSDRALALSGLLDRPLQPLLAKALDPNPARRFQDAGDMLDSLESQAGLSGLVGSLAQVEPSVAEPSSSVEDLSSPIASSLAHSELAASTPPAEAASFAALQSDLIAAIARGETDDESLRLQEVAILEAAQTDADWQTAEYLKNLAEAWLALKARQYPAAAERLRQAAVSPRVDEHYQALQQLYQLLCAVTNGDRPGAQLAYAWLQSAQAVSPIAAGRVWDEIVSALPRLEVALELFRTRPTLAEPELEALPVWFQSATLDQLRRGSHGLQSAQVLWREGSFVEAAELYTRLRHEIETLPDFFGVSVAEAAAVVAIDEAAVRQCQDQLDALLALVKTTPDLHPSLDRFEIRRRLGQIVQAGLGTSGQAASAPSRPEVWLRVLDDLIEAQARHWSPAQIQSRVSQIGPHESIHPVIRAVADSLFITHRPASRSRSRPNKARPALQRVTTQCWAIIGVVALASLAGLFLAGPFWNASPTVSAAPTQLALASPDSPEVIRPSLAPASPTPDPCADLLVARQGQNWQVVLTQINTLSGSPAPVAACDGASLAQLEGQARTQLGLKDYAAGNYQQAADQWGLALERDPAADLSLTLLARCAQARAEAIPAGFETLVHDFNPADILATCGFDPAQYLPPTAVPLVEIELLERMAEKEWLLSAKCPEAPCPTLYQDELGHWHFGTFFEETDGAIVLDPQRQLDLTQQAWEGKLREVRLEFQVSNPQPYSFPYEAEFGLQLVWPQGRLMEIGLVSTSPFSAWPQAWETSQDRPACEVPSNLYAMRTTDQGFQIHSIVMHWDPLGTLNFLLDDQPLCAQPIPAKAAPQIGLYFSGAGINMDITRFSISLASS